MISDQFKGRHLLFRPEAPAASVPLVGVEEGRHVVAAHLAPAIQVQPLLIELGGRVARAVGALGVRINGAGGPQQGERQMSFGDLPPWLVVLEEDRGPLALDVRRHHELHTILVAASEASMDPRLLH